ncbi:MAG: hypothetical protein KGL93_03040 [Gemmatimonadota bacterium]|nr:hypothetical protein [Gemmatimonadota bacterium]HEU4990375.1 hypothetical protein [Gemmatimonadaceae bacterium]
MTTARQGAPGSTRVCPHCRQTILESATVCPVCRHHLRVGTRTTAGSGTEAAAVSPLRVEGTIEHPAIGEPWEYSVMVSVRGASGEEISRHVVGVGAMHAGDRRTFELSVEVFMPAGTTVRAPVGSGG